MRRIRHGRCHRFRFDFLAQIGHGVSNAFSFSATFRRVQGSKNCNAEGRGVILFLFSERKLG